MRILKRSLLTGAVCAALVLVAQTASARSSIYQDQQHLIKAPRAITSIGTNLFGDKVNLYTGALEFSQTDVSLPGNNKLPVAVGRRLVTGIASQVTPKQFGTWDLEIPHLHGIFADANGWVTSANSNQRCTTYGAPPMANSSFGGTGLWNADEYWHGNFLYVPGVGDQEVLRSNTTLTTAPIVTRNLWTFTCNTLQSVAASSRENGEGFTALSPDGITYRFDWLATRVYDPIEKASTAPLAAALAPTTPGVAKPIPPSPDAVAGEMLSRTEVWIMPTQVTDRFGNWVRYTYDPTNRWQMTRIESSDGRVIVLTYNAGTTQIVSVYDGTRTWTYSYSGGALGVVTLPDSSTWQLGGATGFLSDLNYIASGDCATAGTTDGRVLSGSMVHPSGATGTFALTPTAHGRSYVPQVCRGPTAAPGGYSYYPRYFDAHSLTQKSLSGPGLPGGGLVWTYAYGGTNASWDTCAGCAEAKYVMVTNPDNNVTRYMFGNRFRVNEGSLLAVESGLPAGTGESGGTGLRTVTTRYAPFPAPMGFTAQKRGDSDFNAIMNPADRRQTNQQGTTFTWEATHFTVYGNPDIVTRSSSLGMSRTETTVYANNTTKWVLGQVATVTESSTGKVMVANTYDPTTAVLMSISHIGHLDESMTYNADGTLATLKDGKSQTTTFSNYMRGIPQNISYPDLSTESAVVNNIGGIATLTNAAGYTTTFGYDAMGRLASITHPASDTVAWNVTNIATAKVAAAEFDLAAGHWRETVTTGNAQTITYYDALLRPAYTYTNDVADTAGTSRIVKRQYDFAGRTSFESYPKRSYGQIADGVSTSYDALGRVSGTTSNSELGTLWTSNTYNGGFQKTYTDARSRSTTTSYQAFDEPSESAISTIAAPEGVSVAIVRDVFGKSTSITRSGAGKAATRSYVYDANERLCKTIEPETGATVQDYDAANNVLWRATGLNLPSTTTCDTASVAAAKKIGFGYDTLNRLTGTTYGDGSPAITRTYTADSLPNTVTSNGAVWTNTYNKRRLNERESLVYGGTTYNIDRAYDPNGSLLQLKYPDSTTVGYNPNALGEPRQVGTYAGSITYHPSGAIASFTYGNGITHSMTQNVRALPQQSIDTGAISDQYSYDANANVTGIADLLAPSVSSRTMTYDDLDRLKTVSSPSLWGSAGYTYDALDNLTATSITGGGTARSTSHTINPATNRIDSISGGPAAYNFNYAYDSQGNIIQRGAQAYVFDQGNRMTSATGKATYAYDGLGHRASTVGTDGVNRVSVYTQGGELLYMRATSVPLVAGTKYIYLGRHQIAEVKAAGAN